MRFIPGKCSDSSEGEADQNESIIALFCQNGKILRDKGKKILELLFGKKTFNACFIKEVRLR